MLEIEFTKHVGLNKNEVLKNKGMENNHLVISLKCKRFPGAFAYYELENLEMGSHTQHFQNNIEDSHSHSMAHVL